jgi:hypothetical protein
MALGYIGFKQIKPELHVQLVEKSYYARGPVVKPFFSQSIFLDSYRLHLIFLYQMRQEGAPVFLEN